MIVTNIHLVNNGDLLIRILMTMVTIARGVVVAFGVDVAADLIGFVFQ